MGNGGGRVVCIGTNGVDDAENASCKRNWVGKGESKGAAPAAYAAHCRCGCGRLDPLKERKRESARETEREGARAHV